MPQKRETIAERPKVINRPVELLLNQLQKIVEEKNLGYSDIQRAAANIGIDISLYKIRQIVSKNFSDSNYVSVLDSYIDAILRVIGLSDVTFLNKAIDMVNQNSATPIKDDLRKLSPSLRAFILNPNNQKYLEHAYFLYQQNEEREKREKEL
jgi:hypothetical protein